MKNKYLLIGILAVGAFLRLYGLGAAALWYDETFTAHVAIQPLNRLLEATAGDVHPPLYYLIIWGAVKLFGSSEIAVRLPSVVFSLAAVYLFYRLVIRLGLGEGLALAGALAVAVVPTQIHFSQEARMYSLLQLLVIASLYFTIGRRWVPLGLVNLVMLYTHYYSLFYLAAIAAAGICLEIKRPVTVSTNPLYPAIYRDPKDRAQTRRLLAAFIIPGALWLPWAAVLLQQTKELTQGYWIRSITMGAVIHAVYMQFTGFNIPPELLNLTIIIVLVLLLLGIFQAARAKKYTVLTLALLPLAMVAVVSVVVRPVILFRGFLGSAPFLYLLLLYGIGKTTRARLAAACVLVPVALAGLVGYYQHNPEGKSKDAAVIIQTLKDNYRPGDIIYHVNDGSAVVMSWYLQDLPHYVYPTSALCGSHDWGALSDQTRSALGFQSVQLGDLAFNRAWVVYSVSPMSIPCEVTGADRIIARAKAIEIVKNDNIGKGGLYLYER